MPLLFSIITVTYNAREALERTLQSVGVQTYGEMEYLVIDGGSTDGTMERVARWEAEMADERTRRGMEPMRCVTVSEPDRGLYDAMNKGLQRATGDYVWFLNAGDTFRSPETVAQLADVAEGMTTRNRKASLAERYRIMCCYYGTLPTQMRHLWFATRFLWAKVSGNKA